MTEITKQYVYDQLLLYNYKRFLTDLLTIENTTYYSQHDQVWYQTDWNLYNLKTQWSIDNCGDGKPFDVHYRKPVGLEEDYKHLVSTYEAANTHDSKRWKKEASELIKKIESLMDMRVINLIHEVERDRFFVDERLHERVISKIPEDDYAVKEHKIKLYYLVVGDNTVETIKKVLGI